MAILHYFQIFLLVLFSNCATAASENFFNLVNDKVREPLGHMASIPTRAQTGISTITPKPILDRDIAIHRGFGTPTTDHLHCQVCTRAVVDEDECHSIKGCTVQTSHMTLNAGTTKVNVGTLTGESLYTSVSSAPEKICPTPTKEHVTSCSGEVTIDKKKVPFVSSESIEYGELVFDVEVSNYTTEHMRKRMIQTIAKSYQEAAKGKNCKKHNFMSLEARSKTSWWVPSFFRRDVPHEESGEITLCNSIDFSGPRFLPDWWLRDSTALGPPEYYIDARLHFKLGSGGPFDCAILEEGIAAFAFIFPELAGVDAEIEAFLSVICGEE